MLRRLARPALIWWLLAALLASAAVVSATGAGRLDFRKTATCTGYGYGQTSPTVSLGATPATIFAGSTVTAFGWLGQNGCGLPGEVVQLQRQQLINEAPSGSFVTVASTTTDADGLFTFSVKPYFNTVMRVVVPAQNDHGSAASPTKTIRVRPRISVSRPIGPASQPQVISGTVTPNKAGRTVYLYVVTPDGNELIDSTTLTSSSTYRFSGLLPKGYTSMFVYIKTTPTNTWGYVRFRCFRT